MRCCNIGGASHPPVTAADCGSLGGVTPYGKGVLACLCGLLALEDRATTAAIATTVKYHAKQLLLEVHLHT